MAAVGFVFVDAGTGRKMTTDQDLIKLLAMIKDIALSPYPFTSEDRCDPGLCLALGRISGGAMKAISDWETEHGNS